MPRAPRLRRTENSGTSLVKRFVTSIDEIADRADRRDVERADDRRVVRVRDGLRDRLLRIRDEVVVHEPQEHAVALLLPADDAIVHALAAEAGADASRA